MNIERNGKNKKYVKKIQRKINAGLGKLWGMGGTLCREKWRLRMEIFDAMAKSVMMYGTEI